MTTRFEPAEIAAEAVERGEDPLQTVVGQYGGYLSACWENLKGAGVFESDRAREATDATVEWLRSQRVIRLGVGERLVLMLDDDVRALESLRQFTTGGHQILLVAGDAQAIIVPASGGDDEAAPAGEIRARRPVASALDALNLADPVPFDDLDGELVDQLTSLSDMYGPLGVLQAAAQVWEARARRAAEQLPEPEPVPHRVHTHPADVDCTWPHCPVASAPEPQR